MNVFLAVLHGCRVLGFRVSGYRVSEKLDRLVVIGLRTRGPVSTEISPGKGQCSTAVDKLRKVVTVSPSVVLAQLRFCALLTCTQACQPEYVSVRYSLAVLVM